MSLLDPSLFLLKGHYFAFFGGLGSISPFLVAIALQFGASPGLIGIIYATLPFFILIAKPSFGILADEMQQRKAIFMACVAIMFSSFFFMIFIPQKETLTPMFKGLLCSAESSSLILCNMSEKDTDKYAAKTGQASCNFECNVIIFKGPTASQDRISFTSVVSLDEVVYNSDCARYPLKSFDINQTLAETICDSKTYTACNVSCNNDFLSKPKDRADIYDINPQIIYLWILMIFAFTFMGNAISLADTIIIGILPHIGLYGQQRLFGPMGYGMLSIISGLLVDTFTKTGQPLNFRPCFCLALIMGATDFLIASRLTVKRTDKPKNLFRHVCRLFVRPETLLFTVTVPCVGFFTGILWTFLIVHANKLGGTQLLSGLIYGTQCFAGEMPFMFLSSWFLRKIGHGHAMTLVLSIFAVRFILYSMIRNPWMILPIEVTQGITFGIFFTALATYSSLIAPPSTHATMQGILQGLFEGLGTGTGSLIGGLVFEAVGGSMMWLIMGLALGILAVMHGLILVMIQRKPKENPPEEQQPIEEEALGDKSPQKQLE